MSHPPQPQPTPVSQAVWNTARSAFLISCLQIQADQGGRSDNGFKRSAWDSVAKEFNSNYEVSYTKDQIKGHYQWLRTQYQIVRDIRDQSGFGWNEETSTVEAEEAVWAEYLKSHPKAKPYRERSFPLFNELDQLLSGTLATGDHRKSSSQLPQAQNENDSETPSHEMSQNSLDVDCNRDQLVSSGTEQKHANLESSSQQSSPEVEVGRRLYRKGRSQSPSTRSSRSRSRTNGSLALADAIQASVSIEERALAHRTSESSRRLEELRLRTEQVRMQCDRFPYMARAIKVFGEYPPERFDSPEVRLKVAKLLRNEETAAFFVLLPDDMRWEWVKEAMQEFE